MAKKKVIRTFFLSSKRYKKRFIFDQSPKLFFSFNAPNEIQILNRLYLSMPLPGTKAPKFNKITLDIFMSWLNINVTIAGQFGSGWQAEM